MQFEFLKSLMRGIALPTDQLCVGGRTVRLAMVRNPRARRYVLRLQPDGSARVTVPRGGTKEEARRFAERQKAWIEKQLLRQATQPSRPRSWEVGGEILFRGEGVRIEAAYDAGNTKVRFGAETLRVSSTTGDLRPQIERHLWKLAARELPPRVLELAGLHGLNVSRVSVRNQRSRWGSCSRRGVISLNWRLVQTPISVRDYIIIHELMHMLEMNHSSRFWARVGQACPDYATSERWLKDHSRLLR